MGFAAPPGGTDGSRGAAKVAVYRHRRIAAERPVFGGVVGALRSAPRRAAPTGTWGETSDGLDELDKPDKARYLFLWSAHTRLEPLRIQQAEDYRGLPIQEVGDWAAAVRAAAAAEEGDAVVMSPASTSFDMFPNFMAKGCFFKEQQCLPMSAHVRTRSMRDSDKVLHICTCGTRGAQDCSCSYSQYARQQQGCSLYLRVQCLGSGESICVSARSIVAVVRLFVSIRAVCVAAAARPVWSAHPAEETPLAAHT